MEQAGGVPELKEDIWKMIAFASRYGHQQLLGDPTKADMNAFCDALRYWIEAEHKNGRTASMNMAEGG